MAYQGTLTTVASSLIQYELGPRIDLAAVPRVAPTSQVPLLFKAVQKRVERAGTNPVAITGKLFEHGQTENRLHASMMQEGTKLSVQADHRLKRYFRGLLYR